MNNVNYAKLYDSFKKVYTHIGGNAAKVGRSNSRKMAYIVRNTPKEDWKGLLKFYFHT